MIQHLRTDADFITVDGNGTGTDAMQLGGKVGQ
jgi:glutamate synthase domain-containing protein 2